MPRVLWVGLIASALCVLGVVVLVRSIEPGSAAHEGAMESQEAPAATVAELASARDVAVDRTAVDTTVGTESLPGGAPELPYRVRTTNDVISVPAFDGGVVEVLVVRDEDGSPVAGARVERQGGWDSGESGDAARTTDARGIAEFAHLVQGNGRFTASAPGAAVASAYASTDRDHPFVSLEIRLRIQRTVTVRLLDALGRPFRAEDWHIERRAADRLGILLTQSCGPIGESPDVHGAPAHRARSAEHESGPFTWKLELEGPGDACVVAVLSDVIVGAEPIDRRATEVSVRLDPAAIESALAPVVVRVLAAAGDVPIEGALVRPGANSARGPELRTGADGRVRVGTASAGIASLVVTAPGFAPGQIALARPYPPEFVVRLVPGRRIEGRVVDQDGSPISGARVELAGAWPGVAATMQSAGGGVFRFHDLPSAEFLVRATYGEKSSGGGGQRVSANVDCRNGDVLDLRLEIPVAKSSTPATPR